MALGVLVVDYNVHQIASIFATISQGNVQVRQHLYLLSSGSEQHRVLLFGSFRKDYFRLFTKIVQIEKKSCSVLNI